MRILKSLPFAVLCAILLAQLSYGVTPDRISGAIASRPTSVVARSLHPKASLENDRGAVDPGFRLDYMTLVMKPSPAQQKALDKLLADLQNHKSPQYHKWLTAAQYADRFGVSQNDIDRVTAWLKSQGFQIVRVAAGRNAVSFSGNAAQVQAAFGTEIHHFEVDGEQHIANASPALVPPALSGVVRTIRGLHDFLYQAAMRPRSSKYAPAGLHAAFFDPTFYFPNFLGPNDISTVYDIGPLYSSSIDGSGQTIAIMGQTDIFLSDITDFRSGFSLPAITGCTTSTTGVIGLVTACNSTYFQYQLVGSDPGSPIGDIGEADLDIQWSGATARKAKIIYVNSPNGGVGDSLAYAVDTGSGPISPIISMSYGICELESGDLETELQQANTEGVTVVMSSGDTGAAACDINPTNGQPPYNPAVGGRSVSYPASSPEVTALGGTGISTANDTAPNQYWGNNGGSTGGVNGTALKYIPETNWNDNSSLGVWCATSGAGFCNPGAPYVPITNAQTFQQDYWISIAGGGASNCWTITNQGVCQAGFAQPTYQAGLTVPNAPTGVRWVPDVALFGSPNLPGYIFCTATSLGVDASTCAGGISDAVDTYGSIVGGTSVSTPVFAGMVALINQYLGGTSASGLGNINPTLYTLAQDTSNGAFHKVNVGDNKVFCAAGTPSNQTVVAGIRCPSSGTLSYGFSASDADSTTGYNLVTGLGSVDLNNLAIAWAGSAVQFSVGATALSPASVAAGHSATSTVTVDPLNDTATTASYTFSCSGQPAGATCSFSPTSVVGNQPTTLTVTTTASASTGNFNITVNASTASVTESTSALALAITTTDQSFTLSPANATYQVTQGQSADATITLTGEAGFNTPVVYTCTDPASESICTGPTGATTATSVQFHITTRAPTTSKNLRGNRGIRIFYAALLPGLLGILFTASSRKRSLRGLRVLGLIVALGASTVWMSACGGGGGGGGGTKDPGTPVGSYTVTINATTGGTNPETGQTTFTLQVQ